MKTLIGFLSLACLLADLRAQTAGAAAPGSSTVETNAPRRRAAGNTTSPQVHTDRTVTFRLRAPNAKEVKVSGEWPNGTATLTNNGEGIWSATVGPLEPDVYGYNFTVDGLNVVDPGNTWVKPMRAARTSIVEIPGHPSRLWEFQQVPHGTIHQHNYYSKSLESKRRLQVYTPPGYEKSAASYPVLYLFHGAGDNDATWTELGRAHFVADNLLAQEKSKPMIIVMTDGHAFAGNPTQVTSNLITRNVELFSEDVLKDVLPLVDATYRTRPGREHRAIIGLSMGGGQALELGLRHRDLFGWVGGMSSYLPSPTALVDKAYADPKKDELKLLWIACGKDDRLIENARQLSSALKERGVAHEFKETPGNHSWPVWRRYLTEFLPVVFVAN